MHNNTNLTTARMTGYASGIISESVLYNMFYTYFLIFLTNVVLINPALAGTIGLVSVIWDGITDPWVGHIVDKRHLDKRKIILWCTVPMGLAFMAVFYPVSFTPTGKIIYYIVILMLFWLFYTAYSIPYYALCGEITSDYDQRTKIRGVSSFINAFAIFIGSAGPVLLVDYFMTRNIQEHISWFYAAVILGIIAIVVGILVYVSTRKITLHAEHSQSPPKDNLIKTYWSIAKLKPFKWFILFVFFFLAGSTMANSNILYLIQYRIGLDSDTISYVLIVTVAGMLVLVPVVTWLSTKTDRRTTCILFFSLEIIGLLVIKLIGATSFPILLILAFINTLGLAAFWTLFYSMAYDFIELDELENHTRREGAITSLPQLVQKAGAAVGLQAAGIFLAVYGYQAQSQSQTPLAKIGIENISTVITAACIALSLIALLFYPINRKRFAEIQQQLDERRQASVPNES